VLSVQPLSGQVREIIKKKVGTSSVPSKLTVEERIIHTLAPLTHFYEQRDYYPAWSNDNGLLPQAYTLIKLIHEADREGLRPTDYHLAEIENTLGEISQNLIVTQSNYQIVKNSLNSKSLAKLDLLLTDAFLLYSSHLLNGRINPESVDSAWLIKHNEGDLTQVLRTALDSNRIEEALQNLLPKVPIYTGLRKALLKYRDIAARGGWPTVPEGPRMEKGQRGKRVLALRERLIATGDLNEELNKDIELFDDALEQAVRKFQQRHGLDADGIVGPSTIAALNVPVEKRISQIELNMERLRWLPQNLGHRYILVNLANFELYVVENNQTVMAMRVIVGKPYWNTPVFSADMTYMVLNPHWDIPQTIFVEEILPRIRKDPEYLSKDKIKVLRSWSSKAEEIDPKTIDWSKVTEENFKYRLRQEPGPRNPLGQIKFMLPNQFNVYLHDTPNKRLFKKTDRNLSHGCIRIEKPIDLAEYVLHSDPGWTRKKIRAVLNKGITQSIQLPEPIPVYLVYFTVWVNEDGTILFRDDIYGRDNALEEALRDKDFLSLAYPIPIDKHITKVLYTRKDNLLIK
jgi:murein L,D-transpeptidase YcbB/YkuD